MPTVDETEPEHIDTILAALKAADNDEDRRLYTRAVARYIEQELVGLSDVASHFVDAVTMQR